MPRSTILPRVVIFRQVFRQSSQNFTRKNDLLFGRNAESPINTRHFAMMNISSEIRKKCLTNAAESGIIGGVEGHGRRRSPPTPNHKKKGFKMSIEELKQLLAELAASKDTSWTDIDGEPMAERDVYYLDGRALRLQPVTPAGVQPDYFFEVRRVQRLSPQGEWVGPFWRLEQFRMHYEEYFSVVLSEWCQTNMAAAGVRCADDDIPATSAAVAEIIRRMIFVD